MRHGLNIDRSACKLDDIVLVRRMAARSQVRVAWSQYEGMTDTEAVMDEGKESEAANGSNSGDTLDLPPPYDAPLDYCSGADDSTAALWVGAADQLMDSVEMVGEVARSVSVPMTSYVMIWYTKSC